MHELSIALNILDLAEHELKPHGWRVASIHIKLGPLSGVDGGALTSAYEMAREGTPFENTSLIIEEVAVAVYCETCERERMPVSCFEMRCAACGQPTPRVVRGRELEVFALEIEP